MMRWLTLSVLAMLASSLSASAQSAYADRFVLTTGCVWTSGSGAPAGGSTCDTYLDTNTGDLYTKLSTGWEKVPRLSGLNVFTAQQELSSAAPLLYLTETDQGSNLKDWRVAVDGGMFTVQTVNDAKSSVLATLLSLDRSGNAAIAGTLGVTGAVTHSATLDQVGTETVHADVLPSTGFTSNLGSLTTKYLTVHAAELWVNTLVASSTLATIGGRVMVAPTTTLSADRSAQVATPSAPTVTPQGTAGSTTYSYKITALDVDGETLASTAGQTTTGNVTLSGSNFNRLAWSAVTGATRYNVYGRTSGSWLLIAGVGSPTFDDTGAISPAGAAPSSNTTAAQIRVRVPILHRNDQPYMESNGKVEFFLVNQWTITAVSTGSKTFTIGPTGGTFAPADFTATFAPGSGFVVSGSTGNDGAYNVVSSTYSSGTNRTIITVAETIPSGTADGGILYVSTVSGYVYTVTRDRDASGSNLWYAGDAILNTGTTGKGFIDLYAASGVLSGTGPTIVGDVRTGTTYNAIAPRWAIGNLNGLYGYAADTYGVAMGDASATNITIDATNGFRIRNGTTDKLKADTSGNLSLTGSLAVGSGGSITAGSATIDTSGVLVTPNTASTYDQDHAFAFVRSLNGALGMAGYDDGSTNRALFLRSSAGLGSGYTSTAISFVAALNSTQAILTIDGSGSITVDAGMVVGSATGGNKGVGTINAQAVYDDNVLLTDWVFEEAANTPLTARRTVTPSSRRLFSLDETRRITATEKRLPWMPTPTEFEAARGVGGMLTRIWQGQEQQQLYIFQLEARIAALEQAAKGGQQ